jgi:protein-S-isoprenylcysteine O-methyltransferase Ste14
MNDDQPFRAILIAVSLLLIPFAIYHRIKSQSTGESLDRRQEGYFILLTLRPIGLSAMLGLIAYMINPSWMAWSSMKLQSELRWTGVAMGILAAALIVWTFRTLGPNLTDTVVTRRNHSLVTAGPYQWVRHPFYVAVGLAVIGNALTAANWFLLIAGLLALALLILRTNREEERLVSRFGDLYLRYAERTGRFFPKW